MYTPKVFSILCFVNLCLAIGIIPDSSWPEYTQFGYLSAVTVDSDGFIYIFERGNRAWGPSTFNALNEFTQKNLGPITVPAIKILDHSGKLIFSTGKNV